jgi:chromate transporter
LPSSSPLGSLTGREVEARAWGVFIDRASCGRPDWGARGGPLGEATLNGTKLMACGVVAHAVTGMAQRLCPDTRRQTIAVLVAATILATSSASVQLAVIAAAAVAGAMLLPGRVAPDARCRIDLPYGTALGGLLLVIFAGLLFGLPLLATDEPTLPSIAHAFYRAGALVFGGGHVVLPLLEESLVAPDWTTPDEFFAGYAAAQAIPGPMFAFSAYLGALLAPEHQALLWATLAVVFMFLPGFLLVAGVLPFWNTVSQSSTAAHAIAGVNAGVVGLLAAALYTPVFTSAVTNTSDMAIVVAAWGLLSIWKAPPFVVLICCLSASVLPVWLSF